MLKNEQIYQKYTENILNIYSMRTANQAIGVRLINKAHTSLTVTTAARQLNMQETRDIKQVINFSCK